MTRKTTREITPFDPATAAYGWNSNYSSDTKMISFTDAWGAWGWGLNIDNSSATYKSAVFLFEPLPAKVEIDINGAKAREVEAQGTYAVYDISDLTNISNFFIKLSTAQKIRLKKAYFSNLPQALEEQYINTHDYPLVTSLGYTTHVTGRAIDFTDSGLDAYIATSVNTNDITFTRVTSVPAGTPLKGSAGCYELEKSGIETEDVSRNKLSASDGTVSGGATIYILSKSGTDAVFAPTSASIKIPKGRAYLDTTAGARLYMSFDNDLTGINDITTKPAIEDNVYYDMQGRRVAHPTKGLYIMNGKKVIIK